MVVTFAGGEVDGDDDGTSDVDGDDDDENNY